MRGIIFLGIAIFIALSAPGEGTAQNEPRSDFFTASDGVRIHYYTQGEEGSWVVLIHGYTDSARRMWIGNGIMSELAKEHRVVALDNRNHGRSDRPVPNGTGRAEDVIELMDHLGIESAHIHGYSMGGGITGRLLATHPQRFVTASFGGSGISEVDPEMRARASELDPPIPEPQGVEAAAFDNLRARAAAGDAATASPSAGGRQVLEIDLRNVTVPVLAINGEFDRPYSRTHRMWRELNDFTNVVLPGRNHMSAIGVGGPIPPEYLDALSRFISSNDK